jgi:hypothetical protein
MLQSTEELKQEKAMIELIEEGTEPNYVSLYDGATLEQAGKIWHSVIKSDGGHCPVCDRWGKLYKRGISANMARQLIWLCKQTPREDGWVDVQRTAPDWMLRAPQIGALRYWYMTEAAPVKGVKSRTAGLWRPTQIGLKFAYLQLSLPKFKYVYNDTVFDTEGPDVTIIDCLDKYFDYSELMKANYYGDDTGSESEEGGEDAA